MHQHFVGKGACAISRALAAPAVAGSSSPPRRLWWAQAPVGQDSNRIPRVQSNDAEAGKVLHVPRYQCKAMFKGRRGDHAVRRVERSSFQLTLTIQHAPAISDGECDWQDASMKPGQQVVLKPPLQLGTSPAGREKHQPSPKFSDRHYAELE